MVVGACRITLAIPGNESLKGKRAVVRPIVERLRARFNVSVAEVGLNDSLRSAMIGFAVVSNQRSHAESMVDTIVSFVERDGNALLVERHHEIVSIGTFESE